MHPQDIPNASAEQMLAAILDVVSGLRAGRFTAHLPENFPGDGGRIAKVLNGHMEMLEQFKNEVQRVTEEVGVTGRLGGQMEVQGTAGDWTVMMQRINEMAANITDQFRDGANVVRAHRRGDVAARMGAQRIQGEFREFREEFNTLLDERAK
jgi:methyl-accepting chemotaxis protein